MNMNETMQHFGRGRGRGRGRTLPVIPIQGGLMGPPQQPPRRSTTTPSSSSHVNWRSRTNSGRTTNSGGHTGTSTRTRSSLESESPIIIALSEGRGEAIYEVGIAYINLNQPGLILCQITDTQSYINTLTKINILNPTEILVPLTFIESFTSNRLVQKVKEQFPTVKMTGVSRSTFNKNIGMQYLRQLCLISMNSVLLVLQHRYYALTAAGALLSYAEVNLYVMYAKESIKIEYQESEGYAIIDVSTASRLELVACARPTIERKYSCLFDILNHCYTKIGALSLRATILQPPCTVSVIEARLNCVKYLIEHGETLPAIQIVLQKLSKIDQLLSLATLVPDHPQSCCGRQLNYLLLLNSVLEQIPFLQDIFQNSTQPYFSELKEVINNPVFDTIKDILKTMINTDAHPAKGKLGLMQRCFAIKHGVNHLLDLVRKSYLERLEEMREYVKGLSEKYSFQFTLNQTQQKGYHIVLTLKPHQKKNLKKTDLPVEFIQIDRLAGSYTMKTQKLIDLSSRVEDLNLEVLKMSNIMIYKLLVEVRKHIGVFYSLCENISKLDVIQALAQASNNPSYVKPEFSDYLDVVSGKHPLLNFLLIAEPTPNSIFASEDYNMNIITGPNGSGKSIFIRQVALLQIMAQVGCYVPAESATFRVTDRILARLYFEDNMVCGASTFALEIKEINYFLTVLTKNTLIIIDEICRSTAAVEGTAGAMAICERFLKTPAFVFFTTHFKLLTAIHQIQVNVKLLQMETLTEIVNNQMVLRFTYRIIPGINSLEHYGLFLAKGTWPENAIKYAETILTQLTPAQKSMPVAGQIHPALRLKHDLESRFKILRSQRKLSREVIHNQVVEYNEQLRQFGFINLNESFSTPRDDVVMEIFQEASNLDITGNICDYYNKDKAHTSYQELSQNLSLMLQEKADTSKFTRQLLDEHEEEFFANISYDSIFEPEVMINTGENLQLNISQTSAVPEPFQPEKLFNSNPNPSIVFHPDAAHTIEHNTSYNSINELKFSLPLQQTNDRTSTPMGNPICFDQNIKDPLLQNFESDVEEFEGELSKLMDTLESDIITQTKCLEITKINEYKSNPLKKSTTTYTTASSSIKWFEEQIPKPYVDEEIQNSPSDKLNIISKPTLKSSQEETESYYTGITMSQDVIDHQSEVEKQNNFKESTTNSSSVKWIDNQVNLTETAGLIPEESLAMNTKHSQFTDAEVADITKELESCSEYFFETEDWVAKKNEQTSKDQNNSSSDCSLHNGPGGYQLKVVAEVHPFRLKPKTVIKNSAEETSFQTEHKAFEPNSKLPDNLIPTVQSKSSKLEDSKENNKSTQVSDIITQNVSLEPLGNIHLELFSDESVCEQSNLEGNINNDGLDQNNSFVTPATPIQIVKTVKRSKENENVKRLKKNKWKPPYKNLPEDNDKVELMDFEKVLSEKEAENLLQDIINRPTFKQVQQLECIASVQKTESGIISLPIEKKRKSKRKKFISPMLKRPSEEFDITLFSDKNVQIFEDYTNSSKKGSPFVRTKMSSFHFIRGKVVSKHPECTTSNYEEKSNILPTLDLGTSASQKKENTQPGYYTQHKEMIDDLVDKYLNKADNSLSENVNVSEKLLDESFNSSIFSQLTKEL
ncbi:hypothetical protein FQR65_LT06029 [Abscondita terminalis]|nr:hypothetical protein FQR65_LT06029 [Abscondita terminalis]